MLARIARVVLALLAAAVQPAFAQPVDHLVLSTDWFAEAEHGGFYQAVAEGIYRRHGLDVVVQMGGPQVNGLQLAAAGRIDIAMGDALQVLAVTEQHVPLVAIAATFQKNPTVIIAHPGVASLGDLKGKPIAVGAASNTTFWPWLRTRYGFDDAQKRPYGFSVQPFLADPTLSQQGFVTSEPYSIEKAGIAPRVFLLADLGYPPYSEVMIVSRTTLAARADALKRFVIASAEGWQSYLANPAPANALIRKANPQMTDELLDYGYRKMKEYRLVDGGDAEAHGLMSMNDARWQATLAFIRDAGIAKPGIDYTSAWTTALSLDTRPKR